MSIGVVYNPSYKPIPGLTNTPAPAPVNGGDAQQPPALGPDSALFGPQPPAANNPLPPLVNGPMPMQPPAPVQPVGGFSWLRATGQFFRGFVQQGVDMVVGMVNNPLQTALFMGAGAVACAMIPWASTALMVGFAAWGGFKMLQGAMAAKAHLAAGDVASAEADFQTIGRGGFEVTLALGPWAFRKLMNKLRGGGGVEVGVGGQEPKAARGTKTPKAPKGTKTPKGPKPKPAAVEPTVTEPAATKTTPTTTKPAKPGATASNIGKGPKNGRAGVGSSKPKPVKPAKPITGATPEVEVTTIADKPVRGRAGVGSAPEVKPKPRPRVKPASAKATPAVEVTTVADAPVNRRAGVGSATPRRTTTATRRATRKVVVKGKTAEALRDLRNDVVREINKILGGK